MKKPSLKSVLIVLGVLILLILIKFPYDNLRGKLFQTIYKKANVLIISKNLRPALIGWPGFTVDEPDILYTLKRSRDEINLTGEHLTARVGIGSLIPFGPLVSIDISELKQGGDLYVKAKINKSRYAVYMEADEVELKQIKLSQGGQFARGLLSAEGDVHYAIENAKQTSGDIELQIESLKTYGRNIKGISLPTIDMGNLDAQIDINEGQAKLVKFKFGNEKSEAQGTLKGSVKLAKSYLNTFVDLHLTVKLRDDVRKNSQYKDILGFVDDLLQARSAAGDYNLCWKGTIRMLRSRPLPEKCRG